MSEPLPQQEVRIEEATDPMDTISAPNKESETLATIGVVGTEGNQDKVRVNQVLAYGKAAEAGHVQETGEDQDHQVFSEEGIPHSRPKKCHVGSPGIEDAASNQGHESGSLVWLATMPIRHLCTKSFLEKGIPRPRQQECHLTNPGLEANFISKISRRM
ncbi:hypothetical protein QYF36_002514 [Acer negundo]|nr:hypothetical protein QYF36_002514 [Acer negundo]